MKKAHRRKTYCIRSRFRFTIFLTLLLLIAFLAGGFTFEDNAVNGMEIPLYLEIEIQPGDTLWQIAGEYNTENKDLRKFIHEICRLNGIQAGDIYAGQILQIPVAQNPID